MAASPMDLSASQYERKDLAGQACGLVKVQLAVAGAQFEGNVIGTPEYKTGEYWVYMSEGSYMLTVKHPNFVPLRVNFRDLNIPGIQSKITYELTLLIPQANATMEPFNPTDYSNPKSSISVANNKNEAFTVKGVKFNMVYIEEGTFMMGRNFYQQKPVHQVTLSSYFLGETEVTQELWKAVMGRNPSKHKGKKYPVENVSWEDCQEFIRKLNVLTGKKFRLPTEAEWEYAARGGKYANGYDCSGSNDMDKVGWYSNNSGLTTHDVGLKSPNELGLFDMSGNVNEWCQDWFGEYLSGHQTNPTGPSSGSYRLHRGGDYSDKGLSVYTRKNTSPDRKSKWIGLRLAL